MASEQEKCVPGLPDKHGYDNDSTETEPEPEPEAVSLIDAESDTMSTKQGDEYDSRLYKIVMGMFLVLNVFMVGLNAMAGSYLSVEIGNVANQAEAEGGPVKLCVLCERLRQHPEDSLENITRHADGQLCCADRPQHVESLVHYFTEDWMKYRQINDSDEFAFCEGQRANEMKPSIKVVGLSQRQPQTVHNKLLWNATSTLALHQNPGDIAYLAETGQIQITKAGQYFVYSQLKFDRTVGNPNPHKSPQSEEPKSFEHFIYLDKTGNGMNNSRVIMSSIETKCPVALDDKQETTSYMGTMFKLNKGDLLSVRANAKEELSPVPHMNIFGAYMVTSYVT